MLGWDFFRATDAVIDCGKKELQHAEILPDNITSGKSDFSLFDEADDLIEANFAKQICTLNPDIEAPQGHIFFSANVSDIRKLLSCWTLTCARCAEVGHESTDCTRTEKCVNCKGEHTSFSRNCSAWKQEREIISTKIKNRISYQEARKLIKSQTPTPGNSYVSAVKKSFSAPSVQTNPDASAVSCSKPSDSTAKASPITNLPIPSSPSVAPVSEEALASPDFTDFKLVTNRKKLKKDSPTKTNNSIAKAEKISKFYLLSP
ncbi:hypothetical protein AVEN_1578-1 [Araneus ventricosus]|uniref:CCHC-type domain-containing protein n=1 Tax=Araneus ventricosus TaxID=182803 RepID=A0A4Y2DSF2_ARAVE|nr:hypothetical protein AVEN_1578-1 [Araneus ventricosus]